MSEPSSPTIVDTSPGPAVTGGSNSGNIFNSAGGPPLILVFLATGLLVGALLALLVLRRVRRPAQRLAVTRAALERQGRLLREKPFLWDVHLEFSDTGIGDDKGTMKEVGWDQIQPVSARFIADDTLSQPVFTQPAPQSASTYPVTSSRRTGFTAFYGHLHRDRTTSAFTSDSKLGRERSINGRLQLAVTVAMPRNITPPNAHRSKAGGAGSDAHLRRESGDLVDESISFECCLGLIEEPCQYEEYADIVAAAVR